MMTIKDFQLLNQKMKAQTMDKHKHTMQINTTYSDHPPVQMKDKRKANY